MKGYYLILLLLLPGCIASPPEITISVNHSRQIIKVTGLSETTLNGIKHDSISLDAWQNLFPVMAMPADTGMRDFQRPVMGKYNIDGQAITFTPDSLFKKGHTYFARFYHYDKEISVMDLVLHKRMLGKANYTELIFKY